MCLGVPGQVIEVYREDGLLMGRVDFGGVVKRVCLEYVPEAAPGAFILVHAGFALKRLEETDARRTLDLLDQAARVVGGAPDASH